MTGWILLSEYLVHYASLLLSSFLAINVMYGWKIEIMNLNIINIRDKENLKSFIIMEYIINKRSHRNSNNKKPMNTNILNSLIHSKKNWKKELGGDINLILIMLKQLLLKWKKVDIIVTIVMNILVIMNFQYNIMLPNKSIQLHQWQVFLW